MGRVTYAVADGPKMLRETLCVAQLGLSLVLETRPVLDGGDRIRTHQARLQRLIDECDRKRPLGPDGSHGDRHTAECGCEDGQLQPEAQLGRWTDERVELAAEVLTRKARAALPLDLESIVRSTVADMALISDGVLHLSAERRELEVRAHSSKPDE